MIGLIALTAFMTLLSLPLLLMCLASGGREDRR